MKITDYKNEEAIELLADIIEPASAIFSDEEIKKAVKDKEKKSKIASIALKNHKKDIIEIMARIDGVPVSKYKCNPLTLVGSLVSILNDKDLADFFSEQEQVDSSKASISAVENTKE